MKAHTNEKVMTYAESFFLLFLLESLLNFAYEENAVCSDTVYGSYLDKKKLLKWADIVKIKKVCQFMDTF